MFDINSDIVELCEILATTKENSFVYHVSTCRISDVLRDVLATVSGRC